MTRPATFKTPMLSQNRTIALLISQIQQQNLILQHVRAVLPGALAAHASHCVIKDDKLLLYTDSAVWATQLRFSSDNILAALVPITTRKVDKLHIKVMTVQTGPSMQHKRKANLPSMENITMLQHGSRAIEDEALRNALLKLGSTLERLASKA